jgi:hypothetical protein
MKKQRGMNGHELAAVLNAHPEIVYDEKPSCPDCAVVLTAKSAGEPTPARRSGSTMAIFLAMAAGAGAGAAALFANEHPVWGGWVAVMAAAIFIGAFVLSFAAVCPHCRAPLMGLSPGVNGPCGKCRRYLRLRDGSVAPLEEEFVQGTPSFGLPIDGLHQLPALCAGCGKQATRTENVTSNAWPGMSLALTVPHCDSCKRGALFQSVRCLTGSIGEDKTYIGLMVKSHRFYHLAMTANSPSYRLGR